MSYLVEQLPYCDLLRLSPFDWMICLVSLTSRPNNWASLKKEKGRVLWTFWFRVLCLFYLAKVEGGPTVFGLSALSLLFFGGWLQYYPTRKGRVLRFGLVPYGSAFFIWLKSRVVPPSLACQLLLFFSGWPARLPTWKGRVLRTCFVVLCLFYLVKVEGVVPPPIFPVVGHHWENWVSAFS